MVNVNEYYDFFKAIPKVNNIKEIVEGEEKKDLVFIDSSSIIINLKNLGNVLNDKENLVLLNDKISLERTLNDLEKIGSKINLSLPTIKEVESEVTKLISNKNVIDFYFAQKFIEDKHKNDLEKIYNHFKSELEKHKEINISGRIVKISDYIKVLEIKEKDGTERYNLLERIVQVISGIMLVTLEKYKLDNLETINSFLNFSYQFTKEELEHIKEFLVNEEIFNLLVFMIFSFTNTKLSELLNKDPRLNLFLNFFDEIPNLIENSLFQNGFLNLISFELSKPVSFFIKDLILNEELIKEYQLLYNKYAFIHKELTKLAEIFSNFVLKDFFIMVNKFENKLFFSFFELKDDYVKNLVIYFYALFYNKIDVYNLTLTFWDESIFNTFLKNFITRG